MELRAREGAKDFMIRINKEGKWDNGGGVEKRRNSSGTKVLWK